MEMERCQSKEKQREKIKDAVALVLDLAKAVERVSLPCGLRLGDTLQLPKENLAGALRLFSSTRGGCSSKECAAEQLANHQGHFVRTQAELFACCALYYHDALSEVMNRFTLN